MGTPTGIHAMDPESALKRAEQGMQFIAVGSDLRMLNAEVQRTVKMLWPKGERKDLARY
jgi:4-hydroxy-2-oxoheptanedioate aldolase